MKRLFVALLALLGGLAVAVPIVLSAGNSCLGNGPCPTVSQMDMAIHGQESGGALNARRSARGAVGGHQISPGTFKAYRRDHESIDNPADNAAVGLRIVADLMRRYSGDPARVAVAYFSGPGNVSLPGAKRPWVVDANDGEISTSEYVSQVLRRLPRAVAVPAPPEVAPGSVPPTVPKAAPLPVMPPPPPTWFWGWFSESAPSK